MKRKRKQLLGALGLVAVIAMTAFAFTLPTSAESAETIVKVTVIGPGKSVIILSPRDGETVAVNANDEGISLTAKASQENINKIQYLMTCTDESGAQTTAEAESIMTEPTGTDEVTLSLPASLGNSDCTLKASGFDDAGAEVASDQVAFKFRAMNVVFTGKTDARGNPEVMLVVSGATDHVALQVHDKKGNPIFVNAAGEPEAIEITRDQFTVMSNGNLSYTMYLPMDKYQAPAGSYDLVSVAYEDNGKVISMNVNEFSYDPEAAGVPSAGSIAKDLNISRADFILTGIILFTVMSGFTLYLIFRKRHQA